MRGCHQLPHVGAGVSLALCRVAVACVVESSVVMSTTTRAVVVVVVVVGGGVVGGGHVLSSRRWSCVPCAGVVIGSGVSCTCVVACQTYVSCVSLLRLPWWISVRAVYLLGACRRGCGAGDALLSILGPCDLVSWDGHGARRQAAGRCAGGVRRVCVHAFV